MKFKLLDWNFDQSSFKLNVLKRFLYNSVKILFIIVLVAVFYGKLCISNCASVVAENQKETIISSLKVLSTNKLDDVKKHRLSVLLSNERDTIKANTCVSDVIVELHDMTEKERLATSDSEIIITGDISKWSDVENNLSSLIVINNEAIVSFCNEYKMSSLKITKMVLISDCIYIEEITAYNGKGEIVGQYSDETNKTSVSTERYTEPTDFKLIGENIKNNKLYAAVYASGYSESEEDGLYYVNYPSSIIRGNTKVYRERVSINGNTYELCCIVKIGYFDYIWPICLLAFLCFSIFNLVESYIVIKKLTEMDMCV